MGRCFLLFAFSNISTVLPKLEAVMHHVKMSAACNKLFQVSKKRGASVIDKLFWHLLFILIWIHTDGKGLAGLAKFVAVQREVAHLLWGAIGGALGGYGDTISVWPGRALGWERRKVFCVIGNWEEIGTTFHCYSCKWRRSEQRDSLPPVPHLLYRTNHSRKMVLFW